MDDFIYVSADQVKKGMMINHTAVRNEDAENFLVISSVETEQGNWYIQALNSDGEIQGLVFSMRIDGTIPNVRVFQN